MRKILLALLSLFLSFGASADPDSLYFPALPSQFQTLSGSGSISSALLIDAAGEKVAMLGHLHIDGDPSSTKTCSTSACTIGFRTGAVTWAAASSAVIVSLQDVTLTAGPVAQPDETADVSFTFVQGTTAINANAWNTTGTMDTGTKTVSNGSLIAIVWDFSVRNGADSVVVSSMTSGATAQNFNPALKTGGTWANPTSLSNNAIITFDDGTLGWIEGSFIFSANSDIAFKSDSAADEYAIIFTAPNSQISATGIWMNYFGAAGGDASVVLYSDPLGTPVSLGSITTDANVSTSNSAARPYIGRFSTPIPLRPGKTYGVALLPSTTTNVTLSKWTVSAAAHRAAWPGGTSVQTGSRADGAGAFGSLSTVQIPMAGIIYTTKRFGSCCDKPIITPR